MTFGPAEPLENGQPLNRRNQTDLPKRFRMRIGSHFGQMISLDRVYIKRRVSFHLPDGFDLLHLRSEAGESVRCLSSPATAWNDVPTDSRHVSDAKVETGTSFPIYCELQCGMGTVNPQFGISRSLDGSPHIREVKWRPNAMEEESDPGEVPVPFRSPVCECETVLRASCAAPLNAPLVRHRNSRHLLLIGTHCDLAPGWSLPPAGTERNPSHAHPRAGTNWLIETQGV